MLPVLLTCMQCHLYAILLVHAHTPLPLTSIWPTSHACRFASGISSVANQAHGRGETYGEVIYMYNRDLMILQDNFGWIKTFFSAPRQTCWYCWSHELWWCEAETPVGGTSFREWHRWIHTLGQEYSARGLHHQACWWFRGCILCGIQQEVIPAGSTQHDSTCILSVKWADKARWTLLS